MTFGKFVEIVMWYKHISRTELAKALDTSITSIERLLSEPIKLTPMKMKKLSDVLDVPLEVLFMWQGYVLAKRYNETVE